MIMFFNQNFIGRLDMGAEEVVREIDGAGLRTDYTIVSGINGELLNIDRLSTGCKTALTIHYFPEKNLFELDQEKTGNVTVYSLKEYL